MSAVGCMMATGARGRNDFAWSCWSFRVFFVSGEVTAKSARLGMNLGGGRLTIGIKGCFAFDPVRLISPGRLGVKGFEAGVGGGE